ncbi:hypothetical protein ACF8PD_13570 [Vibrio plantisponsor]|uniref:hypothetical protein n=1 Tax=Vibrio plantisponsor TaxID=664643 RepID=UPI00370B15D3
MEANLKTLLANVRPEEVTEEPVEILPFGLNVGDNTTVYTLPNGHRFSDFEYIEAPVAFAGSTNVLSIGHHNKDEIRENSVFVSRAVSLSATGSTQVNINKLSDTTFSFATAAADTGATNAANLVAFTGYKRRYSKISLAEITEAASKPNLFNNTWHAGAKVRNQRGFDGNWGNLAVGAYGLDGWLKTSPTHKGFIVAAGSYKPSTKYIVIAEDGGILAEVISPADGGNWSHSFPFAADKFVLREGNLPLGWSPDTDAKLDELNKRFLRFYAGAREYVAVTDTYGHYRPVFTNKDFARPPTITKISGGTTGGGGASLDLYLVWAQTPSWAIHSKLTNLSGVASTVNVDNAIFELDATIKLSEVTDDAEHRVVWGA